MPQSQEPPAVDPDNVPETLCIGRMNIAIGPGSLATLTFTHVRNVAGPLIDQGVISQQSVVRARVVTTMENIVSLRDLLSSAIQDNPAAPGGVPGSTMN